MSEINDGGPAFPVLERGGSGLELSCAGLSQRDFFAAHAMSGWLASFGDNASPKIDKVASFAYEIADAMLAARGQQ